MYYRSVRGVFGVTLTVGIGYRLWLFVKRLHKINFPSLYYDVSYTVRIETNPFKLNITQFLLLIFVHNVKSCV